MKKIIFWVFIATISVSFPDLIFAQDSGSLSRAQLIAMQMNCVESQLGANKGVSWNDVCDVPQAPPSTGTAQSPDTNTQPAVSQDTSSSNSYTTDQVAIGPFDPISTRIISDPLFLPLKGQIYGSTMYSFDRTSYREKRTITGAPLISVKEDNNDFSQTLSYGLTDDLTLQVSDSYEYERAYESRASGGGFGEVSEGFTNPQIGATYRVLDQNKYPVDFDLSATFSPNAFQYKPAANGYTGTVASGYPEGIFMAAIGREMKDFTVQAYAEATYQGNETFEEQTNHDYDYKQRWQYTFGINTQTRLTDRSSINLDVDYILSNNVEETDLTSVAPGNSWVFVPSNIFSPTIAFNYQIIPNRLVGSLSYEYEIFSSAKNYYQAPGISNDDKTVRYSDNIFSTKLSYLF